MKTLLKLAAALALLLAVASAASAQVITVDDLDDIRVDGSNWGCMEDVRANSPEIADAVKDAVLAWFAVRLPEISNTIGVLWITRIEADDIVIPPETLALLNPPPPPEDDGDGGGE